MHLIPKASTIMALTKLADSNAVGEDEVGTDFKDQYLLGESVISIGDSPIFCRGGWI